MIGSIWKMQKMLFLCLYFLVFCFFLSGCIAKSSEVDSIKINLTDLTKVVKANHPKDENIDQVVKDAVSNEMRQSGIMGKAQVDAAIKLATGAGGKLLGIDLTSIVGGLLGFLGIGGAGVASAGALRRRRQRDTLAEMEPAEAKKMKGLI